MSTSPKKAAAKPAASASAAKAPRAAKKDALDLLAEGDPKRIIALMLWKARLREPDLFVQITEKDIEGFDACTNYLKVVPGVMVKRPAGLPYQPAQPAAGNRRAVPAREATPAKPFVIVALVEDGTENAIRPVENNETDYDAAQAQAAVRKARDQASAIAQRILNQAKSGEYSLSDIQDAADALITLARAV